jgi:endonuclease/exonuclease/phosphatase family metal-dependent hydrolase
MEKTKGNIQPFIIEKPVFKILAASTFWLSETPGKPGKKGWDAACNRIVTWAKLEDRKTGNVIFHFNTHLDHMGQIARRESARLILKAVDSIAGKNPALVTGDFNAFPLG